MSSRDFLWQEPSSATVERLEALAQRAFSFDEAQPFSEQTLVEARKWSRGESSAVRILEVCEAGETRGFAALVTDGDSYLLEAAVDPSARERGLGTALITEALTRVDGEVAAWVHGGPDASSSAMISAQKLAKSQGFVAQRELFKMGLALTDEARASILAAAEATPLPADISLETYTEKDAAGWVEANAAAFADHPEQGKLTLKDLEERTGSDWFRAEGFFLAKDGAGSIAGSHWTKIPHHQTGVLEGEVYAVGVTPDWQGKGLGRSLTLAGMAYLARTHYAPGKKLDRIVLYVDAENSPAVTLYRSLGFSPLTIDRQYLATAER